MGDADIRLSDEAAENLRAVEELHSKARAYFEKYDRPGEWLDEDGSWKDWESEAEGRAAEATAEAYAIVLKILRPEPEPYYDPPDGFNPGTVFDPCDSTFGPIMAAIQAGDFEKAAARLTALATETKGD